MWNIITFIFKVALAIAVIRIIFVWIYWYRQGRNDNRRREPEELNAGDKFLENELTSMDATTRTIYHDKPPARSAEVERSIIKKYWQINADMWNAAGYWTDVRARYGELTNIDIDKLAKHHKASAALDAFCGDCQKKGMAPDECARAIIEYGFAASPTGNGPRLGQLASTWKPNSEDELASIDFKVTVPTDLEKGGLISAAQDYYLKTIKRADEIFAEDWPFDPAWVGTLSVASDLDTAKVSGIFLQEI